MIFVQLVGTKRGAFSECRSICMARKRGKGAELLKQDWRLVELNMSKKETDEEKVSVDSSGETLL